MKLQTDIRPDKSQTPMDYSSQVLLMGSCFVENIGEKLGYFQFRTFQNPFGILFHPLAIENTLRRVVEGGMYSEEDIFQYGEHWHCFEVHSSLSSASRSDLLSRLNAQLNSTKSFLKETSHVIITLGTAWVYHHKERDITVANCHKVPQNEFEKRLLGPEEIASSLKEIIQLIRATNKTAQIIFTVSPVRHLKDGFVENQRSKAHLISAVHQVLDKNSISYFPSYEIMMDELRDYRFYERDMVHPNEVAIDIIWSKFKKAWISPEAYPTMDEVEIVQKGLKHKPFNPDSEAHRKFKTSLATKISYLQDRYPFMKFD